MPRGSFEDLLLDYTELSAAERASVDTHVSGCADCREYLETTARFDVELLELHAAVNLSPVFQKTVFARIEAETSLSRPSMLPEVLDFIGWAGIIIAVVC